jgi:pyrimidine deaminase RibD-like protein
MPEDRLDRVRYHSRILRALLGTYDQAKDEKLGIVRGNLYRQFERRLMDADRDLPALLPGFSEEEFLQGRDAEGNTYNVMAMHGHLLMAIAVLQGDLDVATRVERPHMEQAVQEATKSVSEDARVHPRVGVVVVKDGVVLAVAHRGQLGAGEHAEYTALERQLSNVGIAGATVYTTLEPCTTRNHPKIPCASRLIERKVARVVIGMMDPDTRIRGLGFQALRDANIAVDLFPEDLMSQIEEMNRDFRRHLKEAGARIETPLEVVFDPDEYPECVMKVPDYATRLYRVGLINRGPRTLEMVTAHLSVQGNPLGVGEQKLCFKDDRPPWERSKHGCTIHPGTKPTVFVDVLSVFDLEEPQPDGRIALHVASLEVQHHELELGFVLSDIHRRLPPPASQYRFALKIEARDMPPVVRRFVFDPVSGLQFEQDTAT